jgi:isopenicillin N synthase-like dioxygenase
MAEIPIIDIGPLVGRSARETDVAAAIGSACRETGFFYVVGHGIAPALVDTVFKMSREFFGQPLAAKQRAAFSGPAGNRGWIKLGNEALDPGKPHDLKEAFNIGLELAPDDPEVVAGKPFRGVNCWPDLADFRTAGLAYFDACWSLGRTLHRAFAIDLGLAPDFFEEVFDRPMATLRLLHYPPAPPTVMDGQLGAGEHTDYGNLTLLATDEAGGLMVRHRSGQWIKAPVVPNAFVCNIGDCLMRWTNDVYVSTPHKVESPPGRHRYSVAFFPRSQSGSERRLLADLHRARAPREIRAGLSRGVSPLAAGADLRAGAARRRDSHGVSRRLGAPRFVQSRGHSGRALAARIRNDRADLSVATQ